MLFGNTIVNGQQIWNQSTWKSAAWTCESSIEDFSLPLEIEIRDPGDLNLKVYTEIGAAWVWIWKFKLKLWLLEFESEFSNWNLGCLSLNLKVQIETLEFEFEFSNWNLGRWDLSLKFQNEVLQSVFVDSSPIIKFLPIRWIMFHAYHIYESCFDTTKCKSILLF